MDLARFAKIAVLVWGLVGVRQCTFGSTITVASSASETSNNFGRPTIAVANVDPIWAPSFAGSSWISYGNSGNPAGAGFMSPPNGTSVTYTDTFDISGTPISGTLNVRADDTASVTVNGVLLVPQASSAGNNYTLCSDSSIGCLSSTGVSIILLGALQSGMNTITFDVTQENGVAFGLDYSGSIDFKPSGDNLPEPPTIRLSGFCLLVLFMLIAAKKVRRAS